MKIKSLSVIFLGAGFLLMAGMAGAQERGQIHPINQQLVQVGLMPVPKYYPEIPRITSEHAYSLYLAGRALFVLISHSDRHLILGGVHLTENLPPRIDPNRLPFQPGQVLIVYCP
ncbi:hypothetical protein [Desulfonatronovibrio hydrogenovorans]|uniref:hypothetical protein n=1 Tax=Desulfonatronovibrio hydrogenovorans TaxID=53245 RepID=UPI00048E5CCE|nr:hypothetical protein [Desulfonatronovibrio hydrogenovorans]